MFQSGSLPKRHDRMRFHRRPAIFAQGKQAQRIEQMRLRIPRLVDRGVGGEIGRLAIVSLRELGLRAAAEIKWIVAAAVSFDRLRARTGNQRACGVAGGNRLCVRGYRRPVVGGLVGRVGNGVVGRVGIGEVNVAGIRNAVATIAVIAGPPGELVPGPPVTPSPTATPSAIPIRMRPRMRTGMRTGVRAGVRAGTGMSRVGGSSRSARSHAGRARERVHSHALCRRIRSCRGRRNIRRRIRPCLRRGRPRNRRPHDHLRRHRHHLRRRVLRHRQCNNRSLRR